MKSFLLILCLLFIAHPVMADKAMVEKHCGSCHDLNGPAAKTVEELWQRKGPDLFYAGSKYKRDWLIKWLVKPRRLRPAGYLYFQHIKPGEKRDVIDTRSLKPHISLAQNEASKTVDYLMSLKAKATLIKAGEFKKGSISISFGEMVFDKFNGCTACHELEPGYGGLSGPEMYSAAKRMQADYLVNYIRNPQAWSPKTMMPNKHVAEANIQKIVQYLIALSKENWDEKK